MARLFNGTSDKVVISSFPRTSAGVGSRSFWFYYTGPDTGTYEVMLDHGNGSDSISLQGTPPKIFVFLGTGNYQGTGAVTILQNTWYNYVITVDGSGALNSRLNDVLDKSAASGFAFSTGAAAILAISNQTNIRFFPGRIADVAVWNNVVLTAGEITALARGVRPYLIRSSSLTGYWPVDGLSSPEPDLSGNARNGTVTGTTLANGQPVTSFTPKSLSQILLPSAPPSILFGQNIAAHYNWQIAPMEY